MNESLLNSYLKRLDKALSGVSVSDKAEIVTEIKSHILDTVEANPDATIASVIRDLGDPDEVAKRYLNEKGISYQMPQKQPFFKWVVIGFLGTLGILMIFTLVTAWLFSPIIKVDEESGRVKILGGMIDVNHTGNGSFHIDFDDDDFDSRPYKGSGVKDLTNLEPDELRFSFKTANVEFKNTKERVVKYHCTAGNEPEIKMDTGVTFNLKEASFADCEFEIPENMKILVKAKTGNMEFNDLKNPVTAELKTGNISFHPNSEAEYTYETSVKLGHSAEFKSSTSDKAYSVRLKVKTGNIN